MSKVAVTAEYNVSA